MTKEEAAQIKELRQRVQEAEKHKEEAEAAVHEASSVAYRSNKAWNLALENLGRATFALNLAKRQLEENYRAVKQSKRRDAQ